MILNNNNKALSIHLAPHQVAPPDIGMPAFLTIDCLMTYITMRMRDLDKVILDQFNTDQQNQADQATLQSLYSNLSAELPNGMDPDWDWDKWEKTGGSNGGNGTLPTTKDVLDARTNRYDKLDRAVKAKEIRDAAAKVNDPKTKAALEQLAQYIETLPTGGAQGKTLSRADVEKNILQRISDAQSQLGSGREMRQMQLQSIISQRQTALQMCSNILSNVNETVKSIVNNMKG
jgi:hypothetical protein